MDRHVFAIKRAQQRALETMAEKSRQAGETDRYADLLRQLRGVKKEIQTILLAS